MKTSFFFILLCFANTIYGQTIHDTVEVIHYIATTELSAGSGEVTRMSPHNPVVILRTKTTEWDLGKSYLDRLRTIAEQEKIMMDTAGLHFRMTMLPFVDLSKYISSRYKLILSNLLPDDTTFVNQLTMSSLVSFTTPLFFNSNRYCIIELKGSHWRSAILLQKENGKWTKKTVIGGWIL